MSLFHRRSIQTMLEECAAFLTDGKIKALINALTLSDERSLYTQWELALLFALHRVGRVIHEPNLGGRQPDIHWTAHGSREVVVADVRTVSDRGLHRENPREFYRNELWRRVKLRGFNPSNFFDYPQGKLDGPYGDRKMRLQYPKVSECDRLFNENFDAFLREIDELGLTSHQCRLVGMDFDVTISYDGSVESHGGGNPAFTNYYSLTKNPMYRALQKKADQLRKTQFEGPKGIILADGGCSAIRSRLYDPTRQTYSEEDVIWRFLLNTRSISFVMTAFVVRGNEFPTGFGPLVIAGKFFENPNARHPISAESAIKLWQFPDLLPRPKLDAWNAANHLKNGWDGPHRSWYSSTRIKMDKGEYEFEVSSRALMDMLAGRITREKFAKMHSGIALGGDCFKTLLERGYAIQDVRFRRLSAEDDDHVIIVLDPDVSAEPYRMPRNSSD